MSGPVQSWGTACTEQSVPRVWEDSQKGRLRKPSHLMALAPELLGEALGEVAEDVRERIPFLQTGPSRPSTTRQQGRQSV